LALLATLLLSAFSLLLAFLVLLLVPTAGETPHEAFGLVGYPSDSVLSPLDGLPGLVGNLACGLLCSSALLLLTFLALLLLLRPSGLRLRGARLLCRLLGLRGGRDLQVEETTIFSELQIDENTRLILDGARGLALFVGGPLTALRTRQIGYVAYYLLVYGVALLVYRLFDYVALLIDGALDRLALLVGGGLAEQLGTGGYVLGDLADLIDGPFCGVLNLPGGLARGVLDTLHGLPGLVGDAPKGALTLLVLSLLVLLPLLLLVAFAHLLSLRRTMAYRLSGFEVWCLGHYYWVVVCG